LTESDLDLKLQKIAIHIDDLTCSISSFESRLTEHDQLLQDQADIIENGLPQVVLSQLKEYINNSVNSITINNSLISEEYAENHLLSKTEFEESRKSLLQTILSHLSERTFLQSLDLSIILSPVERANFENYSDKITNFLSQISEIKPFPIGQHNNNLEQDNEPNCNLDYLNTILYQFEKYNSENYSAQITNFLSQISEIKPFPIGQHNNNLDQDNESTGKMNTPAKKAKYNGHRYLSKVSPYAPNCSNYNLVCPHKTDIISKNYNALLNSYIENTSNFTHLKDLISMLKIVDSDTKWFQLHKLLVPTQL